LGWTEKLYLLGTVQLERKKYSEAIKHFKLVLKQVADSKRRSDLFFNIGLCFERQADHMAAIVNYEQCLFLKQGNFRASLNLGRLLQVYESDLKAQKYFKNAIRIEPYSVEAVYCLSSLIRQNSNKTSQELISQLNRLGEKSFKSAEKSRDLYEQENSPDLAKKHANEITYSITTYTQAVFIGLLDDNTEWDIESNFKYLHSNLIHDPIFGQNQAKTKQIAR
jgi:tetratricopeptide (TPR) repeat protein